MVSASRNAEVYFRWDGGSSSFHSDSQLTYTLVGDRKVATIFTMCYLTQLLSF